MIERLMVFFASSLDLRRIDQEHTPYLFELLKKYPCSRINNIPEADLIPTLMTGRYPHEHGIWQVRLRSEDGINPNHPLDYIPDIVTSTTQCLLHMFKGPYDLAAVPYGRRRRFEIFKTRYRTREKKNYLTINGFDTILNIIGEGDCDYIFNPELDKLDDIVSKLFHNDLRFELVQDYGLDRLQHWFLDNKERIADSYKKMDGFIKFLHSECKKRGITLMILSDHGMELVKSSVNIIKKIDELGIKKNEITYFIEAPKARFWFHSDSAREKMLDYLSENTDGVLLSYKDMHKFNIKFEDDRYGEYYFILNPGTIFFPNDYYHPIANLYLGLTEKQQRSRLVSPLYRGYHGYMPYSECEKGFLMLLDEHHKTSHEEIEIIDFAPSVLNLLGYEKPESLNGINVFDD